MTRYIEFVYEEENLIAKAEMLDCIAPNTCDLVWRLLPVSGYVTHAIYSGAEVAMVLPEYYPIDPENATSVVLPWEIFFVALCAKDYFDVNSDFSEFAFFYDRNSGPHMLDGLVKVNIFAKFISGQDELHKLCLRIRWGEGRKAFTIRRASE